MNWTGITIFIVTYALISARRLTWLNFDRPAGALVGAVCCVVFGVLAPSEAIAAVNGPTILLLFGVMGMGTFLALDGFFEDIEHALVHFAGTPARLLCGIVWGAGILSAFITNDAVCVLGAPLVVRLIQRHELPALPFLLALATAAAASDYYKWVDAAGSIHFSDSLEGVPPQYRNQIEAGQMKEPTPIPIAAAPPISS